MKKSYIKYLFVVVLAAPVGSVQGQTHYVGLSPKIGYAALLDNAFNADYGFDVRTIGGVDAGLSVFYELEKDAFHFQTGLDIDYVNSTTRIKDFVTDRPLLYPDYGLTYHYHFKDWKETRNTAFLTIPVMFGAQFNKLFFLAGPKVAFPVAAKTSSKGDLTVTASQDRLYGDLEEIFSHEIETTSKGAYKNSLSLKPTFSLGAEIGMDLDEWLAAPPPKTKRGRKAKRTFKHMLHYRVSAFADYGLLSLNNYEKNLAAAQPLGSEAVPESAKGMLPIFNGTAYDLLSVNTVSSTNGAKDSKLNPLTVGVKFTVMYEFDKKQPKKKPQPKPKPQQKPQPKPKPKPEPKPEIPPVYMCCVAHDKETGVALTDVSFEIFSQDGENTLFTQQVSSPESVAYTKLTEGTYSAYIRKNGYLPYADVFAFAGDTVRFFLQEIKENVVTLLDVHFATNKTVVLPESVQVLEDLYDFLSENPTVRIRIVGHTDSVGSEESNQRLSEGRARSVTKEMTKRGIDPSRLEYEGKGENSPIDTNDTEEGRARNRRVEFVILSK